MLATACPAKLGQKSAVVIALGKAHDDGHSSTVYCLNISDFEDEEARPRVEGNPYRLHDQNGWYIWPNKNLRAENIHDGSIIVIEKELDRYRGNTGKKMVRVCVCSFSGCSCLNLHCMQRYVRLRLESLSL